MNTLLYSRAASKWTEALPLGNGRIGAMHFGGLEVDRFQLNEDTLWSGPDLDKPYHSVQGTLAKARKHISDGQYDRAIEETKNMFGPYTQAYMPLGDLKIKYLHGAVGHDYKRQLDLNTAVSHVQYTVGYTTYTREAFISHPHQVLAIRLTSSVARRLDVMLTLDSLLKSQTIQGEQQLGLQGICPEVHSPVNHDVNEHPLIYGDIGESKAIHFEGRLAVKTDGHVRASNGQILIEHASEAILYVSIATSFNGFNKLPGKDLERLTTRNESLLDEASNISYDALKSAHISDYQSLFQRVYLSLGQNKKEQKIEQLDTDVRIREYGSRDLELVSLLFQYRRYLLIASSREGTQPANLQGIWNDSTRAPWSSNYTLNINTEMNYWPAEVTNLSECHEPLLTAVGELAETGAKMAKARYGTKGWTAHHNTDLWRHAHPVGGEREGDPIWAFWPMSGPWLARHLWEHYLFTQDKAFLSEKAYPLMKGAAEFCLDWLIEDEQGYLTTSPSTSPEHLFCSSDGQIGSVTQGATMDLQIINDLFNNCIDAASVLNIDDPWIQSVQKSKARLFPYQIGAYGQLQEWALDYEDVERHHRHVSHLYGLFPGTDITDQHLLDAVRQTLNIRGDAGTGWSLGWKMNLWARLQDGERVNDLLHRMFNLVGYDGESMTGGGIYPNLLGAHPPFQIDGNFGYTSGVAEMIIQSHAGYVHLLPALPSAWHSGKLTGVCARGGFVLDIHWEQMNMSKLKVTSKTERKFILKSNQEVTIERSEGRRHTFQPKTGLITLDMLEKETCTILF